MTTASDVDSAASTLTAAITAYTAGGGNATLLAQWLISQLKQSDQSVARALEHNITRFISDPPDRRAFATIG